MKKRVITSVLAVLTALTAVATAQNLPQEYLGLPGDNLNLYAVLDLFRSSKTLEAFERGLNDRNNRINNLDLNGDMLVDYITVTDYHKGKVHNIVLRAMIGRNEYQDVAVIIVEKKSRKRIVIQIIGDPLLYGRDYVIEPYLARKHRVKNSWQPAYYGSITMVSNSYYRVWEWPVIINIYSPGYTTWSSSWYWDYTPSWWEPWDPWYWDYYYGYHSGWDIYYHSWYQPVKLHHQRHYTDYYYASVRQYSPRVVTRINNGVYRTTYSRPALRDEGKELYRSTRTAVASGTTSTNVTVSSSRSGSQTTRVARRTTPSTTTRSAGSQGVTDGSVTGTRRQASAVTSAPASTRATAPAGRGSSGNAGRSGTVSEDGRRGSPATVIGDAAEARAAQERAVAQERAAAQERVAAQERAAELRATEQRATEARAAQERAVAQERAAAQAREAERRAVEARESERRATELRATEQRAAEQRAAEQRAAEQRAAENTTTRTVTSGRANEVSIRR